MWELFLKWGLVFIGILGGTCLLASITRGCHRSVKNIFGVSNDQLFGNDTNIGILPAYFLSIGVFSVCGGILSFFLTLLFSGTGKTIPGTLGMSGLLGYWYIMMGRDFSEDNQEKHRRLIGGILCGASLGIIAGGSMMQAGFAGEGVDEGVVGIFGVILGWIIGGFTSGIICRKDKIFNWLLNFLPDRVRDGTVGGCVSGAIVGMMVSGPITCMIALGLAQGIVFAPFGIILGISVFFPGLIYIPMGAFIGIPITFGIWGALILVQHIATRIAVKVALVMTILLSLLKSRTILCNHCFHYTQPFMSQYKNGIRYCENCNQEVEDTKDPGKLIFTFGICLDKPEGQRVFLISNPDVEKKEKPFGVSEVYINTKTCNRFLLERFITYIVNYPPKHGIKSVRIFYQGNLNDLGENLKNALHNTFTQVEQIA